MSNKWTERALRRLKDADDRLYELGMKKSRDKLSRWRMHVAFWWLRLLAGAGAILVSIALIAADRDYILSAVVAVVGMLLCAEAGFLYAHWLRRGGQKPWLFPWMSRYREVYAMDPDAEQKAS